MDGLSADDILDRQRLRRKLSFWRVVTIIAVLAGLAALGFATAGDRLGQKASAHIARIDIAGTLTVDDKMLDLIDTLRANDLVQGVIVNIDSPGGTTAGGEALYDAMRRLADEKPVVAQIDTLAASAGYMVAAATDHIVARQSSIVGSIGVIVQYPNFTGLLDNWGIDVRAIKSTPLKAEPSFFGEPPPGAEAMIRAMILDSFDWFKDLVAERRGFDAATINRLADGSVFTGRQGLENGLVDTLGGRQAARDWLTGQGLDEDLDIVTWEPRRDTSGWLSINALVGGLGVEAAYAPIAETLRNRLFLDGLVSLWHAETSFAPLAQDP